MTEPLTKSALAKIFGEKETNESQSMTPLSEPSGSLAAFDNMLMSDVHDLVQPDDDSRFQGVATKDVDGVGGLNGTSPRWQLPASPPMGQRSPLSFGNAPTPFVNPPASLTRLPSISELQGANTSGSDFLRLIDRMVHSVDTRDSLALERLLGFDNMAVALTEANVDPYEQQASCSAEVLEKIVRTQWRRALLVRRCLSI